MQPSFEDARLKPILEKVRREERLSFEDGVALYRTPDILALGYMANLVRERLHGDKTYFNVNRHINPTDVCVASCRLCAFGKRAKDPTAYTMSLEQVWETAGQGYSEAVTEFHIVGGLHPELTLDWYLRDDSRIEGTLPPGSPESVHDGRNCVFRQARQNLDTRNAPETERCRRGFNARRRCRDLLRTCAAHHLRSQNQWRRVARIRPHCT